MVVPTNVLADSECINVTVSRSFDDTSIQQGNIHTSNDKQVFWFELVDAEGKLFAGVTGGTGVAKVVLPSTANVDDLKDAVKLKNCVTLANVDVRQLQVFKNQAVFDDRTNEPLASYMAVKGMGVDHQVPIWVVVSPEHDSKNVFADLTRQLKSFKQAHIDADECCIVSQDNVPLPNIQDGIKTLFVRECYKDVFDLLVTEIITHDQTVYGLSGTAGIGKSMFFLYILFRIMNCGPVSDPSRDSRWKPELIVYHHGAEFKLYDLINNVVVLLKQSEAEMKVNNVENKEKTFYFIDGRNSHPLSSSSISLFISSPRTVHFENFITHRGGKEWFLPVWTLQELVLCRQKCYDSFPQNVLEERFRMYGGVARFVFQSFKKCQNNPSCSCALASVDAALALSNIGTPSMMFETSHTLLHIIVSGLQGSKSQGHDASQGNEGQGNGNQDKESYQYLHLDIASEYVGEQLWIKHDKQSLPAQGI